VLEATVPSGYSAQSLNSYRKYRPGGLFRRKRRSELSIKITTLLHYGGLPEFRVLVLLIACANLANLILARASSARRNWPSLLALGARAGGLIRQLLSEGLVLAAAAPL